MIPSSGMYSSVKDRKTFPSWEIPDPYDASAKGKQVIDRALAKV